jgi:AraC-like DNA-binding protein
MVMCAEQVATDVLWVSRGSIEAMRSHLLEVLWELVAIVDRRDVVDRSTSSEITKSASARLGRAGTTKELAAVFTALVRELTDVVSRPGVLGRRAKVDRARRLVESAGRGDAVSLRAVARRVGLSAKYLSHCFKKAYGVEFGRFVVRSRVERAKALLRDTAFRVVDVSAEAGFSSPSYFHQAFRRMTGTTPEQYRRAERIGPRK